MNLSEALTEVSKSLDTQHIDNILLSEAIIITDRYDTRLVLTLTDKQFHLIGDLYNPEWTTICRKGNPDPDGPIRVYRYNNYFNHLNDIIDELNNPTNYKSVRFKCYKCEEIRLENLKSTSTYPLPSE